MRDYGRVYSKFWTSADMHALSDDGRMLALYLLSGPHGTLAGVCRLPDGYMAEDLNWSPQRVAKGFAELARKRFANRCEATKWVWIRRFLEWNTPENPNQWKAARKIAATVPHECAWKPEFMRSAGRFIETEGKGCQTVDEGLPTQDQDQDQDQDQEQEQEQEQNKRTNKPFRKGSTKAPFDATTVPGLDAAAWERWVDYRRDRKPALKPASLAAAAASLAKHGETQAAVVDHSIANGYQGLYAPKSLNGTAPPGARPTRFEDVTAGAPDAAHKDQGFG